MRWALDQNDPDAWLDGLGLDDPLISACDDDFNIGSIVTNMRFDSRNRMRSGTEGKRKPFCHARTEAGDAQFLNGSALSVTDIAVFPFIRQFANVDLKWWDGHPPRMSRGG